MNDDAARIRDEFAHELARSIVKKIESEAGDMIVARALKGWREHEHWATDDKYSFVHMAMMGAISAGYPCHVRTYAYASGLCEAVAYIELPQGNIGLPLNGHNGGNYYATGRGAQPIIDEYIRTNPIEDDGDRPAPSDRESDIARGPNPPDSRVMGSVVYLRVAPPDAHNAHTIESEQPSSDS